MNVLSLFDGMSCGQIAINRLGIKYKNYYASEIKKSAIEVTQKNYPKTIQIGDITKINPDNLPRIDLLIGGSPCQDFSNMNKERLGLKGDKSSLLYHYLRLKDSLKPRFWLLENVLMDDWNKNIISKLLGIEPLRINSCLVSAQLRDRLYWTNIGTTNCNIFGYIENNIPLPLDRKIYAKDIIESGYTDRDKMFCIKARSGLSIGNVWKEDRLFRINTQNYLIKRYKKGFENIVFEDGYVRPLNTIELSRLQTVPEGYLYGFDWLTSSNLLGDGWTIDVIAHILKYI